jgi:hypothetical protein
MIPRLYPRPGTGGAGGGGSDADGTPWLPVISGPGTFNPGATAGSATSIAPGRFSVPRLNPSTVSLLPSAMTCWEVNGLVDLDGNPIVGTVELEDLFKVAAYASGTLAPTDETIFAGLVAGPMSATAIGFGVVLVSLAGRWRISHAIGSGTSWTTASATADSVKTMGGLAQNVAGPTGTSGRPNALALDASGRIIIGANFGSTTPIANGQGGYTRLVVGVGWSTGTGGSATTRQVGVEAEIKRRRDLMPAGQPFAPTNTIVWPTAGTVKVVLGIGDSYNAGATTDATWHLVAMQTGYTSTSNGTNQTQWLNSSQSWWPYLVNAQIAQAGGSLTGGRLIRRGQVGLTIGVNTDGHVASMRNDVATAGVTPDVIVLSLGINNAVSQSLHDAFVSSGDGGLERLITTIRFEFPAAPILLVGQVTTNNATYPFATAIEAHKVALAARIPGVRYVSVADLVAHLDPDQVHIAASGNAILGPRIAAAWLP